MKHADLIVIAGQIATCRGASGPKTVREANDVGVLNQGAVVLKDGLIADLGSWEAIRKEWGGDQLHLQGTSVIPGLIDCHCHPLWAGDRKHEFTLRAKGASYEEIHATGGGIAHTVEATTQASDDELLESLAHNLEVMMSHGTTTLEAKSGYGLSVSEELRQLRLIQKAAETSAIDIVSTCLGAHSLPPEYQEDRQSFLKLITDELLPAVKEQELAEFCDVFCERGAFSCQESEFVLKAAKELGFGLKIHAEEFSNLGGSRMAASLGAISCDHLQEISEADLPHLLESGIIPTVIPGTSFFLDLDVYAPARKLWDYGLPVALGTDFNAGSCLLPSMQMAMSLAVLKMKMTPEEALTAATINAAHAVNRGESVGSLEIGKKADLLVLNAPDWRDAIYRFGGNSVRAVIKNGIVQNTVLQSPLGPPL